jgi:phospholipid transport system substrate-binding protein
MKVFITRLCALFLLAAVSGGAPAAAGDPEQLMRDATDKVLDRLKSSPGLRNDNAALIDLIEEQVFPLVDFKRAARLTLGEHWSSASNEQQQRFVAEMQKLLACTYSAAFASYTGQEVEYLKTRWSQNRENVEVRVRIKQEGEQPIPVNYRLHESGGDWKLYDLVVEGVSLVTNYRSTFREKLSNADLDALIADLASRDRADCKAGSEEG